MAPTPKTLQEDLQSKMKVRILGTPFNMQWELVIDFTNTPNTITISMNPKYETVSDKNGKKILWSQQPAIANVTVTWTSTDWTARTAINAILTALRNHWLISS